MFFWLPTLPGFRGMHAGVRVGRHCFFGFFFLSWKAEKAAEVAPLGT